MLASFEKGRGAGEGIVCNSHALSECIYEWDVITHKIYHISRPHNFGHDILKAALCSVLLAKYHSYAEMGGAYGTCGVHERCIESLGGKIRGKDPLGRPG